MKDIHAESAVAGPPARPSAAGASGWQANPQRGWQGPPPQQPYGAPSRKSNRLPLIVAAVLVAVALIGVGAWFLTRPAATPPTVDPSTPSASQPLEPRPTPTVAKRDLTFDDLPQEVNGWRAKPAGTGAYYITEGREAPHGGDALITVTGVNTDLTAEAAASGMAGLVESSDGHVVCIPEDTVGDTSCFIDTSTFTIIIASATPADGISLEEVQAIADAIAAKYP